MSVKSYISKVFNAIFYRDNTEPYAKYLYNSLFSDIGGYNDSGEAVNVSRGSRIPTVWTCVNSISQDIAQLPFNVLQDSETGKSIKKKHPVYRLIHSAPNDNTTAFRFWYSMMFSALTKKRGIAIILRDDLYTPKELIQVDADQCTKVMQDGQMFYKIGSEMYSSSEVFDIDMYNGVSPIMHHANLMGYKIKQEKYSAKAIGTKGSGFISSEKLTAEQGNNISIQMKDAIERGVIPVLGTSGNTQWHSQIITPNEAQYVETKLQTNIEIYGIYRFPPTYAQNYTDVPYGNSEQQSLVYVKHTLMPWIILIEQEANTKLFRENNYTKTFPYFTKINVDSLLRGDIVARYKVYHDMIQDGVFNADEVRAIEDKSPQKDGLGQKYYHNGTMIEKGKEVTPITSQEAKSEINGYLKEVEKLLQ